ncbi:MAG: tryptophan dimethylallyltransferase family protein [Sandaracinaceae bacterium]
MSEEQIEVRCARAIERIWPCVYGTRDHIGAALELVERVVSASPPGWRSMVSDDHTPVELSISHAAEGAELRLLFEAAGQDASVEAQGRAAVSLTPWLRERFGVEVDRLERVLPLFLPETHRGTFGLWHAAVFRRDGSVRFKAYLDPAAEGRDRAAGIVERALGELSMEGAWPHVARFARRGPELDAITFFSLDLVAAERARTKVYVSKVNARFEDLRSDAALAVHGDPEGLVAHTKAVTGGEGVLAASRPIVSCLGFLAADSRPQHVTVHVPVRAYAPNDEVASGRVISALEAAGYDHQPFACALEAFAQRRLDSGSGMIPYISHSAVAGASRVTAYLSLQALSVCPPHTEVRPVHEAPSRYGTAPNAVRRYAGEPITCHPFLQRLAREPLSMERLATVLLNFQRGITRDFSRRLAQTVARVDDDAVRSILAKQLNDELGNGKPDDAHSLLFDRFVAGMRPHAPKPAPGGQLAPGERLGATLEDLYVAEPDAWVAVGATLLMEVFGEQVDSFLGEQFRRQSELPESVMLWLNLHEELEQDHVGEVFELADRIPAGPPTEAALRGVQALATAGWRFFDDLYEVAWRA